MKVLFKAFITVWTRGLVRWLSRKFDSISIDFTPVENKLDDVKSDVADVKTAVENIDFDTSDLAKEATLGTSSDTSVSTTVFGWLKSIRDFIVGIVTTNPYAKESSVSNATTSHTTIGMLEDSTNGLKAIKDKLDAHNTEVVTTHPYAKEATLSSAQSAIISAMPTIPSGLALDASVHDGNDTSISVAKEIRSEVGTSSDTAAETGTLAAVLKWVKNKVKDIYSALTDNTNGLSAIKDAIPTVADIQNGLATIIPTDYAKAGSGTNVTNTDLKNLLNGISTAMYKGVPVVTPQGSGTQANPYVLQPNQWNQFSSALSGGDIYFSKGTDITNITNCYMVRFELAANWSGTSVNFEGFSLDWNGGSVPTWTAGKTYEVNIVDNIAMWAEITPAS